ncbi:MAG: hypothetical protein QM638_01175 [Nocardioides sp.]|uniref:hypothetical protein n=1 Tax=Nocardioides sp. TaxID=35761 RepID=UPI0039E47E51
MSTLTCLHCGASTTNGLVLCQRHLHALSEALTNLAAYYADTESLKPMRHSVRVRRAPASQVPSLGAGGDGWGRVDAAMYDAENTLTTWCRTLADDRGLTPPCIDLRDLPSSVRRLASWLESYATTVATLGWAAECLRDLRRTAHALRRVLDDADTGHFIGRCGAEVGRQDGQDGQVLTCPRGLYALEGESWKTCPECGHSHDVAARRAALKQATADELAPLRVVARAVVLLVPGEPSVERMIQRIKKWVQREQLDDYGLRHYDDGSGPDPVARKHYRIGDVLALVERDTRRIDASRCGSEGTAC